ncbi:hypothetical protein [Aliiroseovarius crassostreae]|uniref:hypothetical protein n=1 Tax=Aliiroseovarius crassostreae TaxID=154981 RepID=UPI003C7B3BB7
MTKQLKSLGELSDMILDLKLAKLQDVNRQADHLLAQNRKMEAAKLARNAEIAAAGGPDLAQFCGCDDAWHDWMGQAKQARNLQLAKLYAEREERTADARKALGRAEVIKTLLAQNK